MFCGCPRPFVCVLVRVRVCVCVVFRAWAFVVPSAFLRWLCCCGGPLWGQAACVCLLRSCPGRFSGPVSCGFLWDLARHMGVGRVRDSSASVSEVLKAESSASLSCEGESHSLSTLNVSQFARSELRLQQTCEGASHRTSELSSYEMAHASVAAHCGIEQTGRN